MSNITEKDLFKKIQEKKAIVGIIGLGYVGSALAKLICLKGFSVIGFEKNQDKKEKIDKKKIKNLFTTTDTTLIKNCDVIILCIQTPIYEDKTPNLKFLENASQEVKNNLRVGQLIAIESSINPGVTRNIILPLLQKSGLKLGKDFFLAFSPERIDPGNTKFSLESIPKVVSGIDSNSLELIKALYENIFKKIVPVSSLETAEMVKVFENTFRFVNISLVNELKEYMQNIGIDEWEVINAASTKPFGFLAHYPGPGAGGHCIPVDPFYLYSDAKKKGIDISLIKAAGIINDRQPYTIVEQTLKVINSKNYYTSSAIQKDISSSKPLATLPLFHKSNNSAEYGTKGGMTHKKAKNKIKNSHKILLIGITYKPDIDDIRESPAMKVWDIFEELGYNVSYHDPYVASIRGSKSVPLSDKVLADNDIYIIITNHTSINYSNLIKFDKPIIDTRHVYSQNLPNIYYA